LELTTVVPVDTETVVTPPVPTVVVVVAGAVVITAPVSPVEVVAPPEPAWGWSTTTLPPQAPMATETVRDRNTADRSETCILPPAGWGTRSQAWEHCRRKTHLVKGVP